MTKWQRWNDIDISKLLAAVACGYHWGDIAQALGRTIGACQMQYFKCRPAGAPKKKRAVRIQQTRAVPLVPSPSIAFVQAAPAPPSVRRVSTAALIADAELRTRIALQGITAGLLGDPLPGRSALDRREGRGV